MPLFANVSTILLHVILKCALTLYTCSWIECILVCSISTIFDKIVLSWWLLCVDGFIRYSELRLLVKM